jgi:pimeloyl-ACP methyl ester carboxylesterase
MPSLELHGNRVAYLDQGRGAPVLLLHSSGSSSGQWRSLIARLSPKYRVIAPDLTGYGATSHWPGRSVFRLREEAAIAHALLDRLDHPAHLVGHSYGGAVALKAALANANRLASLTLVEPAAFHLLRDGDGSDAAALHEIVTVADGISHALARGDYAQGFGQFVDYWAGAGSWAAMPAEKREALTPCLSKVALDFHAIFAERTGLGDLCALGVPTLLVQGACTRTPTQRICQLMAKALPQATLEIVAGAGHMLPVTHRDAANELIAAHLNANTKRKRSTPWTTYKPTGHPIATLGA